MNTLRSLVVISIVLLLTDGCTIRRISDGKPPRDGVVQKEVQDPRYGTLRTEDHYKDGRLVYSKGLYRNGVVVFERFPNRGEGGLDSSVWFFPSGTLYYMLIGSDDRIIRFREFFENGAVRIVSDTSQTDEFYRSGRPSARLRSQNGSIVAIDHWFENGRKAEYSEWLNDQRHGIRNEWDSLGRQTVRERYEHGVRLK